MELRKIVREFDKKIEEVKISPNAILFLYRSYHGKTEDMDVLELSDLDKNKFMCLNLFDFKGRKLKEAGEAFIESFLDGKPIKERKPAEVKPLQLSQPVLEVVHMLSSVMDDGVKSDKVNDILKLDPLIAFFDTWMCLFPPTSQPGKGKWERLFGVPYTNVSLRRRDESYIKKFKTISQKEGIDLGIFIIGTFIFIKSHIHDGKAYIPKPNRLLDDWEPWYTEAEKFVDGKTSKEIESIFEKNSMKEAENTNKGFHVMQ